MATTHREVSINGLVQTITEEGIVPFKYIDSVGVQTYGIGVTQAAGVRDIQSMPFGVRFPMEQVLNDFRKAAVKYEQAVDKAMTPGPKTTQARFDAAFDFHYNTGGISRATWVKEHNAGYIEKAGASILNWNKPPEIRPRRYRERDLYLKGVYSSDGLALVYEASVTGRIKWESARKVDVYSLAVKLWGANKYDAEANKNRNTAGGAAVGSGATASDSVVDYSWLDNQNVRIFLLALTVVLATVAVVSVTRWILNRRRAKKQVLAAVALVRKAESADVQGATHPVFVRGLDPSGQEPGESLD